MAAKKAAVKKAAPKKVAAKKAAPKANSAFMKPLTVSAELALVVGKGPLPRSEVVKKLWVYIKKNELQDQKNKRNINADAALKAVFGGKSVVNMFEMTKLVSKHLS
jgi:chromatin remodeling complex protein RSC6